jgi:hypothetical protein
MARDLLKSDEENLFNIFREVVSYTSPGIRYFTGYIYLHKMLMGDKIHIKMTVNGKIHLYLEYVDQQIMTTIYVNPIPLLPNDTLKIEMRNLSANIQMSVISYIFYSEY